MWENSWQVQSESDKNKFYTVSRSSDGTFGCSCPHWIFRKKMCKHIRGVVEKEVYDNPARNTLINKLRLMASLTSQNLSCENCKHSGKFSCIATKHKGVPDLTELIFVKNDKHTFYILGRCCVYWELLK
jgi:hypothetical protein